MIDINNLFFELIRVALGNADSLSHKPSDMEWKQLYDMAKKQSLVGICFAAVQRLPENERPPEMLYLTWMGMAAKIQQRNEVMNTATLNALKLFRKDGYECTVLKGQGIAKLYGSLAGLRQSGDIDLWVQGGRKKLYDYSLKTFGKLEGLTYHHIHYPIWDDVEIEAHTWPSFLSSPIRNKRLQEFCKMHALQGSSGSFSADAMKASPSSPSANGSRVLNGSQSIDQIEQPQALNSSDTPCLAFNRVFILLHCYQHFTRRGVGMRQLLDYYFVLLHSGSNGSIGSKGYKVEHPKALNELNSEALNYKQESMQWISALGMKRFAEATMWVMKEIFGLEDKYLLCEPNEEYGRFLLDEVMQTGNMGHADERVDHRQLQSAVGRYLFNLKRDIRIIKICPHEALWEPLWGIYQFAWCKLTKMKYKR